MVIGDGGHSYVVEDVVNSNPNMKVIAKLDDKHKEVFLEEGLVKAPISYFEQFSNDPEVGVVIGIGSNELRKRIALELRLAPSSFITAIHYTAVVSPKANLGLGTVVMPGAVINANAVIGDHAIINTGAIVEHDCHVGDYVHISPRATLTGNVRIGEGTQVGVSATIIPGKKIGNWSIVGAGAVVINDFGERKTVIGIPAKEKKRVGLKNETTNLSISSTHERE